MKEKTAKKEPNKFIVLLIMGALVVFVLYLMGTFKSKPAKKQINVVKIEEQIRAILSDESVGEYISIAKIEDDGSVFRVWINLLFEPDNYRQAQTWTDAVCENCLKILRNNGVVNPSLSVWAQRQISGGKASLYGRTYYDHWTDRFEFKNVQQLKLK